MGRHQIQREIGYLPQLRSFRPLAPLMADPPDAAMVCLTLDELEAMRLAHIEGLDQTTAASALGISRPTFGRILHAAHEKTARALVEGRPLLIRGGQVHLDAGPLLCLDCYKVCLVQDLTDAASSCCPSCGGQTREIEEQELETLQDEQLSLLGDRLSSAAKRSYLRHAILLSRGEKRLP